jgi:hypothetical protein
MQKILISVLVFASIAFGAYVFTLAPVGPATVVSSEQDLTFSSPTELVHDWGDINIVGGLVHKTFSLSNTTAEPIYLAGAVSSCMCTVAEFILDDGSKSGEFGMHGGPEWSNRIEPGESFDVKVTFDPMAHGPSATGPISRTVNVIGKVDSSSQSVSYTRIDVRGDVLSQDNYQLQHG